MRLKITRQPIGSIDGIRLDDFIVGFVYDLGTTLGSYLLSQGLAEPADDHVSALVPPFGDVRFSIIPSTSTDETAPQTATSEPLAEAADRSGRPRKGTTPAPETS